MVDLGLCAQKLLFSSLVCQVSSNLIAVLFGLQGGDEVYARPHLLAREFTVLTLARAHNTPFNPNATIRWFPFLCQVYALVLPNTLADPPKSVCHQRGGSNEIHGGAESPGGQVALVLDGAVAADRRHILRHGDLVFCGVNGSIGGGELEVRLRSFPASNRDAGLGAYVTPDSGKTCALSPNHGNCMVRSTRALARDWYKWYRIGRPFAHSRLTLLLVSPSNIRLPLLINTIRFSASVLQNMASEERPAKMRKLEHAQEMEDHVVDNAVLATESGETQADNGPVTQPPALSEEGDAIVAEGNAEEPDEATPKLSKNQLKKQRRWERWESGREDRKLKRKEKIKARKERRRAEWEEHRAEGSTSQPPPMRAPRRGDPPGVQVPITVIFDCNFEEFMHDHELKSLGLQITRSYSDNRKAPFRFHLGISSWGGKMKERFDGILAKQYTSWKGFHFCEEDFVKTSEMSKEWMKGLKGGKVAGALENACQNENDNNEEDEEEGEIVYLSAESDNTLERLKPNGTYIIGGLVDKNRHKGLCYKRALERGIKTAKLPIGEYLQMGSRKVLVTNHVLEIMLKWAEHDDWGKAFIEVLPKRKGGVLKTDEDDGAEVGSDAEEEAAEEGPKEDARSLAGGEELLRAE